MPLAALRKIAIELDVPLSSLVDDPRRKADAAPKVELVPIPQLTVAGGAGPGALVEDERVKQFLGFRSDWLRDRGLEPDRCSVISVYGDSMEPTIHDGSVILVNRLANRRKPGSIFAVRIDHELVVKRLQKIEARWVLASDNPAYRPVAWPKETVSIGEVVWTARDLPRAEEDE